jgi:hypothetical protein
MENQLTTFQENKEISTYFFESGLFTDAKSKAQAFVKIQAGKELGLEPFQSMSGIEIVSGKVTIKPVTAGGLLKRGGKYDYSIIETTDEKCIIEFFQLNPAKSLGKEIYTVEDAKNMGLIGRDNYRKQLRNMLFLRCLIAGIRHRCPDVLMTNIYADFEIEELDDEVKEQKKVESPKTNELLAAINTANKAYSESEPAPYEIVEEKVKELTPPTNDVKKEVKKETKEMDLIELCLKYNLEYDKKDDCYKIGEPEKFLNIFKDADIDSFEVLIGGLDESKDDSKSFKTIKELDKFITKWKSND